MRLRAKNVAVLFAVLFITFTWMLYTPGPGRLSHEEILQQRVAELTDRLHFAESINMEKSNSIESLKQQMRAVLQMSSKNQKGSGNTTASMLSLQALSNLTSKLDEIQPPSIYHHLSHLSGHPSGLAPLYRMSKNRKQVSIVVGIPSVKRDKQSYLLETLKSLTDNLNEEEKKETLLVIMIAEPHDIGFVKKIAQDVQSQFKDDVESGLVEIICPPPSYYPNFNMLKENLGDSKERTKWRTKQNLDFTYLMMYARTRGTYYVQLEDDVIAKPGYVTTMKSFALSQKTDDWILLEFSYLGFIGKLFKSADLPFIVEFIIMFHKDKPIDWLLDHILFVKVCSPDKDQKTCNRQKGELRRRYKPSLFQHVGTHSSLKGKVQKLKDKDFGKAVHLRPHMNPPAEVSTSIQRYQKFSLEGAYIGLDMFWGTFPKAEDKCIFKFNPPVTIEKFFFKSGNPEHPGDRFYNTTVEIMPASHVDKKEGILNNAPNEQNYKRSKDGYLVVGHFNDNGVAEGTLGEKLGPIAELRLHVQSNSEAWVIISEVLIKPVKKR